ncbi:MAG: RNA-binding S4 domain-containing protein [Tissierellales bacterium]|jgi:ribosomal 50S subunit-recycling heat shock protein|nr:RNA-binding S4 domain-containing protein [Tissierellales bacterium]MBN2827747.1 RNA-binding S4 domain-containing protein [Tissierellales bacterium]
MRIDKFLKNSRIIKRRTVAKEACEKGRIIINGKEAKAGSEVVIGDQIDILFGDKTMKIVVESVSDHVTKGDSTEMYKIISS